jgi:MFS family permease
MFRLRRTSRAGGLAPLVVATFLFEVGGGMTLVGLPVLIIDRYGAGVSLGIALGLRLLPNVALGPTIGQLVDERNPRVIAMVAAAVEAVLLVLFPVTNALWQVEVLAVLSGLASMVGFPAVLALRSHATPDQEEIEANSLIIGAERLAKVLGPLVAGPILAAGGVAWLFRIDAAGSLLAGAVLLLVAAPVRTAVERDAGSWRRWLRSPVDGGKGLIRVVRSDSALLGLSITAVTYVCALGIGRVFLAAYAVEQSDSIDGMLGYLLAAMGAGGVLGALATRLVRRRSWVGAYVAGNVLEGLCWLVLPLVGPPAAALVLLFLAGFFEAVATVVFFAAAQRRLARGYTGRYFATLLPLSNAAYMGGTLAGGAFVAALDFQLAATVVFVAMAVPVLAAAPLLRGMSAERDAALP